MARTDFGRICLHVGCDMPVWEGQDFCPRHIPRQLTLDQWETLSRELGNLMQALYLDDLQYLQWYAGHKFLVYGTRELDGQTVYFVQRIEEIRPAKVSAPAIAGSGRAR